MPPTSEPSLIPTLVGGLVGFLSAAVVGIVTFLVTRTGVRRPRLRVHKAPDLESPVDEWWWVNIAQSPLGGKATVTHIWVGTSQGDAEVISPSLPWAFEPGGPSSEWGVLAAALPDEDLTRRFRAHTTTSRWPLKSKERKHLRPAGAVPGRAEVTNLVWSKGVPPGLRRTELTPTPPVTGAGPPTPSE